MEIAPGVHRIPLPLPGDGLRAVNVYALTSPDGVVLVDAGWALQEAQARLEEALATLGHDLGAVQRVLTTHVHRDHYEMAIWLRRLFGTRVALGVGEQVSLHDSIDNAAAVATPMMDRLVAAGADTLAERLVEKRQQQFDAGDLPRRLWELPDQWLHDGQELDVLGRSLRVVWTPGHTHGHVVFVDEANNLIFSGDHVLPHITPSIGVERLPVDSALGDYLASLALVRAMPDLRMLPAHGPVRPTIHDRIDELLVHHENRLAVMHEAVRRGAQTAFEVARDVGWTRRNTEFSELDLFNQMLAVNETAAHLDHLVDAGVLGAVGPAADGTEPRTYGAV